jgi:hypothetical protein
MSYTQNNNQQKMRTEASMKKIRKLMKALADDYVYAQYAAPHKTVKNNKDSYTTNNPKHSGTAIKLTNLHERLQFDSKSPAMILESSDLTRTLSFPGLNLQGSIADISMYLAQRLANGVTPFDLDTAQYGMASFLLGILYTNQHDVVNVLSSDNIASYINNDSKVRVLKGFVEYANANAENNTDKMDAAVETLVRDFVYVIFDNCATTFTTVILELIKGHHNIGLYNSSPVFRNNIRNNLKEYLGGNMSTTLAGLFVKIDIGGNSILTTRSDISFKSWLENKGAEKKVNTENSIPLIDIPALGLDCGILTEVIAQVPAKLRPKNTVGGAVSYPQLGLNPKLAYLMAYSFGISVTTAKLNSTASHIVGENGTKIKNVTPAEAVETIIKNFSKHFERKNANDSKFNINELLSRRSYIDILGAKPLQGTGLNIQKCTDNTALLFPDEIVPQQLTQFTGNSANIMFDTGEAKQLFRSNKDLVFHTLLFCLGYSTNKANVSNEHIQQSVKQIYTIFNKEPPIHLILNTSANKTFKNTNTLGSFQAASFQHQNQPQNIGMMGFSSPPMQQQSGIFQQQMQQGGSGSL